MIFVRETSPDVFTEIAIGAAITVHENGMPDVIHPPQVWQQWSSEDQEALGIYQVAYTAPIDGLPVSGHQYERRDGKVVMIHNYVIDNASLKSYAAAARYRKETAGMMVNGMPVSTDRESQ